MKTRKRVLLAIAVIATLLGLIAITGVAWKPNTSEASQSTSIPVAVEVTPVSPSSITETVSAVGTISAMKDVIVSSETAGRVTKVLVKVGDAVRQGQHLVLVDDELKVIAVDQARAQLLAAETNFKKAHKDFERAQKLFTTGDIADVELEGNRLALHSSEAQHQSALVGLKYAQRQLEDTRIKAPIGGRIASRRVEVGEMVSPGKEIANIVDLSSVKVKLAIPEEEIGKIRLQQAASLRVDPFPGERFEGGVYTIGAKSETPAGHTYPVEVVVSSRNIDALKVGMFARVEIRANSAGNTLTISKESLVTDGANPTLFVVENGIARIRPVKLGLRAGDVYQVLEGLREGELVISFGQKNLKDGAAVQYRH